MADLRPGGARELQPRRPQPPVGRYLVLTAPFLLTFPLVLLASAVLVRWGGCGLVAAVGGRPVVRRAPV